MWAEQAGQHQGGSCRRFRAPSTLAPALSKSFTISICPFAAAIISAVSVFTPCGAVSVFVAKVTQVDTGVCMQQQAHDLEVFVPDGKG